MTKVISGSAAAGSKLITWIGDSFTPQLQRKRPWYTNAIREEPKKVPIGKGGSGEILDCSTPVGKGG